MNLAEWLTIVGVATFLAVLLILAWAYATGRMNNASNEPTGRSGWLPRGLRMKPLGHGIYHAHDQRRAEREDHEGET